MDNQWLTLDEAAHLSGKSPSTLRKKTYKKLIKSDYVNQKLVIDKQSLISFYKLTIEDKQSEPVNQANTGYQADNQTANFELANRYDELKTIHNNMKEKLLKEKNELVEQMIDIKKSQLERYKEFEESLVQKSTTIEHKDNLIYKKNLVIIILLFLFLVATGLLIVFYFL